MVIVSEKVGKRLDIVAADEYPLKLSVLVKSKLFYCFNTREGQVNVAKVSEHGEGAGRKSGELLFREDKPLNLTNNEC